MNAIRFAIIGAIFCGSARAQSQANLDTLFLTDGQRRPGNVTKVDEQSFTFEVPLVPGQPAAVVRIPRRSVLQIEFATDEARDAALEKAAPAQIPAIERLYRQQAGFLGIPRSPAGRIGIRLGELLLEKDDAGRALALFHEIEQRSWSTEDRLNARQGRLRAMIAVGNAAEAIDEARELAKSSDAPEILIEANFILAQAADRELRELINDNPRWMEDDRIRPRRDRLYHEAIDHYLQPYLFFGSRAGASARSLWQLIELHRFSRDEQLALESARDLAALYPDTREGRQAEAWIASLTREQKEIDYEQEAAAAFKTQ